MISLLVDLVLVIFSIYDRDMSLHQLCLSTCAELDSFLTRRESTQFRLAIHSLHPKLPRVRAPGAEFVQASSIRALIAALSSLPDWFVLPICHQMARSWRERPMEVFPKWSQKLEHHWSRVRTAIREHPPFAVRLHCATLVVADHMLPSAEHRDWTSWHWLRSATLRGRRLVSSHRILLPISLTELTLGRIGSSELRTVLAPLNRLTSLRCEGLSIDEIEPQPLVFPALQMLSLRFLGHPFQPGPEELALLTQMPVSVTDLTLELTNYGPNGIRIPSETIKRLATLVPPTVRRLVLPYWHPALPLPQCLTHLVVWELQDPYDQARSDEWPVPEHIVQLSLHCPIPVLWWQHLGDWPKLRLVHTDQTEVLTCPFDDIEVVPFRQECPRPFLRSLDPFEGFSAEPQPWLLHLVDNQRHMILSSAWSGLQSLHVRMVGEVMDLTSATGLTDLEVQLQHGVAEPRSIYLHRWASVCYQLIFDEHFVGIQGHIETLILPDRIPVPMLRFYSPDETWFPLPK